MLTSRLLQVSVILLALAACGQPSPPSGQKPSPQGSASPSASPGASVAATWSLERIDAMITCLETSGNQTAQMRGQGERAYYTSGLLRSKGVMSADAYQKQLNEYGDMLVQTDVVIKTSCQK